MKLAVVMENQKDTIDEAILREIIWAVNSLKYGLVQITVHNSKVVQIDKTEKIRIDETRSIEKGVGCR
jgi:hypothetical protein